MCVITAVLSRTRAMTWSWPERSGCWRHGEAGRRDPIRPGAVEDPCAAGRAGHAEDLELDAARSDVELGIGATWHEMDTHRG